LSKKISDLVSIALERTYVGDQGFAFETFGQNLCRCLFGKTFFATSPFKDDGIDGFYTRIDEELVITKQGKPNIIFQFGTTDSYIDKIKKTYNDLIKRNVNVQKINYYSPRRISQISKVINTLEEELDISINIVDHAQMCTMAANHECLHIFKEFIATMIGSLEAGDDENISLDYSALYLNAWYRYQNNDKQVKVLTKMTDSLIIWALRNTDPDQNSFMSADEIYNSIETAFPSAKTAIKSMFLDRLSALHQMRTKAGRQIVQRHSKSQYCLPLESRQEYEARNEESQEILLLTKVSFSKRLIDIGYQASRSLILTELILHIIKHVFTERGIRLVEALLAANNDIYDEIYLKDAASKASYDLEQYDIKSKEQLDAAVVLRQAFARPTQYEQEYFTRASYLYMMHYIMHNDIGIVSYFQERTKRLQLIVHSDVLVRALSEEYLPSNGQNYRNMLNYLNESGANLIMTEEALTEIYKNLKIATYDYQFQIHNFEDQFTIDSIKFLPVLMTRAYLYSRLESKVNSWNEFIDHFCDPYSLMHQSGKAKEDLRIYLSDKFNLHILRTDEIQSQINNSLADELAKIIEPYKKKEEIAKHVAKVNVYISTIRHKNKEVSKNPFGYQTYWLTHEKTAYATAKDFFDKNELGARLIMRPEFIMQQILLTPDTDSILKSYTATFPTALGVQMSQQLDLTTFRQLMKKLNEINKQDKSRAKAILNDVIQIASEETSLSQEFAYYEGEDIDENAVQDLGAKIENIIKKAEKK